MPREALLEKTRTQLLARLSSYLQHFDSADTLQHYLSLPALAAKAGPYGSFLLNFYH